MPTVLSIETLYGKGLSMQSDPLSSAERRTIQAYNDSLGEMQRRPASSQVWRAELTQFFRLCPKGRILDYGCGAGKDAAVFVGKGYDYTGIDLSLLLLEEARRNVPNATFMPMSITNPKFVPLTFDGIWASLCLYHIPQVKIKRSLQNMYALLKSGGVAFITMHGGEHIRERMLPVGGGPKLFVFYPQKYFSALLKSVGFSILSEREDRQYYRPPGDTTIWLVYFVQVPLTNS